MSVSQLGHSALLRLSGHSVLLLLLHSGMSSFASARPSDSTHCISADPQDEVDLWPPHDGDVRKQSIAHPNDDASWSQDR